MDKNNSQFMVYNISMFMEDLRYTFLFNNLKFYRNYIYLRFIIKYNLFILYILSVIQD